MFRDVSCSNIKCFSMFIQCPRCKSVFHKQCKLERPCPKCIRRRSRREIPEDSTSGHEQSNAHLNSLF